MADYGPRLSEKEYGKRIVALHSNLPAAPSKPARMDVQRRELNLAIDYRLGQSFPQDRRTRLWEIHRRVGRRRMRMGLREALKTLLRMRRPSNVDGLAQWVVEQYREELSESELQAFFGKDEVVHPTLPTLEEEPET